MRILVTGASGLLGLNLALEAAQNATKEHTVFGQVNNHALHTEAFTVLKVDLLAPGAVEQLLERTQPDWVIHCAALAILDACEADPDLAAELNTELPRRLAKHVARGGARLVHISTDSVFDGQRGDYTEADTPNPLSIYARTKLDGERAVAEANPDAIIARVNLFGWSLSGTRSLAEWFFNNLSAGKKVMGFTDVFFCPLLVNDLAHLLLKMLEKGLSGLYHAVGSECSSKYDFGVALARRFAFDSAMISPTGVEAAGLRAARSPNLTLRNDKLIGDLGEPVANWMEGLERFYGLYQEGYPQRVKDMGKVGTI
jgi:dTDP-4-dehydrorhamnose reductase